MKLSDLRGRNVVLAFFGSWSDGSGKNLALLEKLYNENIDGELVILGITVEKECDVLQKFIEENQISFPVLVSGKEVFKQCKVGGIPDTICIDKRGMVRFRTVGYKPDNKKYIGKTLSLMVN